MKLLETIKEAFADLKDTSTPEQIREDVEADGSRNAFKNEL